MLYPLSYEGLCASWKLREAARQARIQAYKLPGRPSNTDAGNTRVSDGAGGTARGCWR